MIHTRKCKAPETEDRGRNGSLQTEKILMGCDEVHDARGICFAVTPGVHSCLKKETKTLLRMVKTTNAAAVVC